MHRFGNNEVEAVLGDMSPMVISKGASSGSVSFAAGADKQQGSTGSSAMSIDSAVDSRVAAPKRMAFGELQNTFEFQQQGSKATSAGLQPFTFGAAFPSKPQHQPHQQQPAIASGLPAFGSLRANASRLQDQTMASPEPTTPGASFTSESRGSEPGPPPLATLGTLNTCGGGGSASDMDTITPLAPAHHAGGHHVPLSSSASPADASPPPAATAKPRQLSWSRILMWQEPLQTTVVFLSGLVAFWLLNFAAYGAHKFTLVSGLSYLLLLDLGVNFFRYFVSKAWHDKCLWGGAAQMKQFLTSLNAYVLHLGAAHDRYLSAVDPFVTLKVAGGLWAAAWLGSFLSLWWCVLLAYVGAFTLPVAYQAGKGRLEAVAKSIRAQTIDRIDAFGLSRTARCLLPGAAVVALWCTSSFTQSAIGFFVALTYWRTLLAPREIDVIRTVAEPYTASAFKVGRRITSAANDAFERMSTAGPKSRTKSHFGAKARME